MRAADDADFIKARLDEREKEREANRCCCLFQDGKLVVASKACPQHADQAVDDGGVALGYDTWRHPPTATAMTRAALRAYMLAKAGYRVGAGPEPVTGKCRG